MIKAIIFDFAGVLTNEGYWGWLKKVVPNIETRKEEFQSLANKADGGIFSQEEYSKTLSEKTGRPIEKIPQEILDGYVVNKEMVQLLARLRQQVPLGLLSNFPSGWLRPLLKKYDLEQYFSHIVISSEVHKIKPDKEIFDYMLSLFSVHAQEVLFIDDRQINVAGAVAVGLTGILFTTPQKLKEELQKYGVQTE